MALKRKKAIDHALRGLGYERWHDGEWFTPSMGVFRKLQLLYDYLGLDIIYAPGYKVVKRKKLPTRAKRRKNE